MLLTVDEKRARLAEIRAERNRLTTEIANLDARSFDAPEERRAGFEERRGRLNTAIERLDEEHGELRAEVADAERRQQEIRDGVAAGTVRTENGDGATLLGDQPEPRNRGQLDGALRAIERNADAMSDAARIERLIRRDRTGVDARYLEAVGDPLYADAFSLMLAHPQSAHLRMSREQAEAVRRVHLASEARAMAEGTGSTGGFGVPFALDPTILLSNNGALNPIREIASTISVLTSEWKGVSSEGVTAEYVAEAAEASDNAPTLAQPVIHLEKAHAWVPFSIEAQQDYAGAGLLAELAELLTDAKARLEAVKMLEGAGHGSHEPEGLLTALTNTQRVQTGSAKVLAIGDVYAVKQAVPARFIVDARWVAAEATYDAIYRLVGGGNTTEPKLMETREGPLLGRPKQTWSTMSTALTTSKAKPLVIGDFDEFRIADRIGMEIELVSHVVGANQRPTGQRGLYAYWRNGSTVLVPNAFRWLEIQ